MRDNRDNRDNRRDNKDRDRNRSNNRRPFNSNPNQNAQNILPPSRVLESYEAIAPGSVNKLFDMAKKEQEHRHSWQNKYLKSHNFSYRTGQVFGLVYNLALLALIYVLVGNGQQDLALKLFVANIALIVLILVVTSVERKVSARKPPRRGTNRVQPKPSRPENKQN